MTQEALRMALEWAEAHGEIVFAGGGMNAVNKMNSWVAAIKDALAQTQEPVATLFGSLPVYDTTPPQRIEQAPTWWLVEYHDWAREFVTERPEESIAVEKITALYTHPPQRTWVGLTDEEKSDLWEVSRAALPRYATYAILIEAKLKEKNT